MTTAKVLLSDTGEIREIEITRTETPPHYRLAAQRGLGPVPSRPVIDIPGYFITQPEITPPEYDYVAERL